jgi:hypothetical protein
MTKWEDISDLLTLAGADKVLPGQVLVFDFEGSKTRLKIRRKAKGKIWAEQITTYTEDEVKDMRLKEIK